MSEHINKLEIMSEDSMEKQCVRCFNAGILSCKCKRQDNEDDYEITLEKINIANNKVAKPTFLDIATNCDRRLPQIGDVYVHFKGMRMYIIDLAYHTETEECLIIYKHNDVSWARPLEMFLSKVDKTQYPDATQEYRFERELPWDITESDGFKDMVAEMYHIDRFKSYTQEEMEDYVLKHFYL